MAVAGSAYSNALGGATGHLSLSENDATAAVRVMDPLGYLGFGILWLGRALLKRADTLKKDTAEAQHVLNLQAPLLLIGTQAYAQSNRIGEVSGNQNVVNAVNTINNVVHQAEDDKAFGLRRGA